MTTHRDDIEIHIHTSPAADDNPQPLLTRMLRRLVHMSETLDTLQAKVDANAQALADVQATVDAKAGEIAASFAALQTAIDELKAGAIAPEALDALGAALDAHAASVTALGASVTDIPVPATTDAPVDVPVDPPTP